MHHFCSALARLLADELFILLGLAAAKA